MGCAAVALKSAPSAWLVAGLAVAAALIGLGNSVATLQLTTFFASQLESDDYAAVLRLRYVVIIGSIMLATAAGPLVLSHLGASATILTCGLAALLAGTAGVFTRSTANYGPAFTPRV